MRTTTHSKAIARLAVPIVLAAAISAPAATADTGQPQQGGGCHMVFSPSTTGLNHMMAGSANGRGAHNMAAMLSKFSTQTFCGA